MAQSVWSLSVDLQTRTATFTSGLADAAKSARGSFKEIQDGAKEMGASTGYSTMEARHSVMLLGEEFGVHLPRALTTFIAGLGPVGPALEAAFPFLAIAAGATILIQHINQAKEAADKLAQAQGGFADASTQALDHLKEELLQVQIRADELAGNHIGAVHKQIELLNLEKLDALRDQFSHLEADVLKVFGDLKTQWYEFGSGSAGAIADMDRFKLAYDAALSDDKAHNTASAQKMLNDKLADSVHLMELFKRAKQGGSDQLFTGDYAEAMRELHDRLQTNDVLNDKIGQSLQAQIGFYQALNSEAAVQSKITSGKVSNLQTEDYQKSIIDLTRNAHTLDEIRKKTAEADEKSAEDRMKMEADVTRWFAEEYAKQQLQQHAAAMKANEEALKDAESRANVAKAHLGANANSGVISKLREQEDLKKILDQEQKDLITAHANEVAEQQRFIAEMETKAVHATNPEEKAEALNAAADARTRLAEATRQYNQAMAQTDAEIQKTQSDIGLLNHTWQSWVQQAHRDATTLAGDFRGTLQSSITQTMDSLSSGIAKSVAEGKSLGETMRHVAMEMEESMISSLLKIAMQHVATAIIAKLAHAHAAGSAGVASMAAAPWPVDMGAPAFGASMAAAALAFETGGIVPGVTRGDTVPALLSPGEAVLPKRLTENLTHAARSEPSGPPAQVHIHYRPTVHALDGPSVSRVLEEHADTFHKHFQNHVRKMNH